MKSGLPACCATQWSQGLWLWKSGLDRVKWSLSTCCWVQLFPGNAEDSTKKLKVVDGYSKWNFHLIKELILLLSFPIIKIILVHCIKYRQLYNKIKITSTVSSKENSFLLLGIFSFTLFLGEDCFHFFNKNLLCIDYVQGVVVMVLCKVE